ncbi:MAG: N-acetylmuramoyl-L-alanine amidase [Acutalibacteraceae bacterium]
MRVFIGVGHGGSDSGAVGYLVEKEVNLVEALACKDFLEMHGVEVLMSRATDENDPITDEINECNAFEPDLAIDVHSNSGRGDGFEAFYHYKGGLSKDLAENIESEVKKIGQNSRGCRTRLNSSGKDYYAFIRETICPAVICEGFFVDNETDVKIADTIEKQKKLWSNLCKGNFKDTWNLYKRKFITTRRR